MNLPPPPDTREAWLDRRVAGAIQPLLLGTGLYEVGLAAFRAAFQTGGARLPLVAVNLASAAILLGAWVAFRRRPPPDRLAHPIAFAVALLFVGNALAVAWLSGSLLATTSLMLVLVGAGALLLRWRCIALVALAVWAGWAALGLVLPRGPADGWLHFGLALGGATVLAVVIALVRVRQERGLYETLRTLYRTNADLEAFARTASHDLRAPLQMIVAQAGMIGLDCDRACSPVDFGRLEKIVEEAERMAATLDSALAHARGEAPEPGGRADLDAALDGVLATLEPRIAETGAVVERGPLGVVPLSEADARRLLQNLVENAIRYRSDAPPRIRVSLRSTRRRLELRVSDNGRGIPRERRRAVLESGVGEHTGLGLAICRRIVERVGGVLRIETGPGGRGTTVVAYLPPVRGASG